MKLSVVGLGKLGVVMAAIHAARGFDVIGLDINEKIVNEIKSGRCPIQETGLKELLFSLGKNKLKVTISYEEAIINSDVSFIIVPTPSDKDDKFSNEYILSAIKEIAPILVKKNAYHLIVITSTVMPGTMERVVKPELEKLTGKSCGKDFGLDYSPEFIALGDVINGMLHPDAILIGESDKYAGDILERIYRQVCGVKPPIRRMNWWNAEVAKISLNVFVTTKMSLANIYAEVCERIPSGNVDDVTGFLGLDSRIGSKYLKGATSYGGECFKRDNKAFIAFAKEYGIDCPIQQSVDNFNKTHSSYVAGRALSILSYPFNRTVSILGLTFKPNTNIITESASLDMIREFCSTGLNVNVFDPEGMENTKRALAGLNVNYTNSIPQCLKNSDLCLIVTPWNIFKTLSHDIFIDLMRKPVILDCWRILDGKELSKAGIEYHAIGVAG